MPAEATAEATASGALRHASYVVRNTLMWAFSETLGRLPSGPTESFWAEDAPLWCEEFWRAPSPQPPPRSPWRSPPSAPGRTQKQRAYRCTIYDPVAWYCTYLGSWACKRKLLGTLLHTHLMFCRKVKRQSREFAYVRAKLAFQKDPNFTFPPPDEAAQSSAPSPGVLKAATLCGDARRDFRKRTHLLKQRIVQALDQMRVLYVASQELRLINCQSCLRRLSIPGRKFIQIVSQNTLREYAHVESHARPLEASHRHAAAECFTCRCSVCDLLNALHARLALAGSACAADVRLAACDSWSLSVSMQVC